MPSRGTRTEPGEEKHARRQGHAVQRKPARRRFAKPIWPHGRADTRSRLTGKCWVISTIHIYRSRQRARSFARPMPIVQREFYATKARAEPSVHLRQACTLIPLIIQHWWLCFTIQLWNVMGSQARNGTMSTVACLETLVVEAERVDPCCRMFSPQTISRNGKESSSFGHSQ